MRTDSDLTEGQNEHVSALMTRKGLDILASQWNTSPTRGTVGNAVGLESQLVSHSDR